MNDKPPLKIKDRMSLMRQWLAYTFSEEDPVVTKVAGDASFRSYYRLYPKNQALQDVEHSLIIMDAPPTHEDCRPYIKVLNLLSSAKINVPRLIAENLSEGFLAISDFGDISYAQALAENPTEAYADTLYRQALKDLVMMQTQVKPQGLPLYDHNRLMAEMQLFPEWFLKKHLGVEVDELALLSVFNVLIANVIAQPTAFVHRDFHSRNIMVLPTLIESSVPRLGYLDFQDAVIGPLSYDVVSILRDAYIDWPETKELDWSIRYWESARQVGLPLSADFSDFFRDYEWMGLQRHLKVLGIFARLYHRDGKDRYLQDLPRVFVCAQKVAHRYRELSPLAKILDAIEPQMFGKNNTKMGYTF